MLSSFKRNDKMTVSVKEISHAVRMNLSFIFYRLEVLLAVTVWDVTPCSLVDNVPRVRWTYYLHPQEGKQTIRKHSSKLMLTLRTVFF
jgi:hypothetical protein